MIAKPNGFDKEAVEALVPLYQEILRLQDWDFKVEIVDDLDGSLANANFGYCGKYKVCKIKLCRNTPESLIGEDDMEHTLVHEMIHTGMATFHHRIKDESAEAYAMETFVDQTARAIVKLRRELEAAKHDRK